MPSSVLELQSDGKLAYSIRNGARVLDVSTSWLFAEIRAGMIAVSKTPRGKILIPHSELLRYLSKYLDASGSPTRPAPDHIQKKMARARAAGR
jgi:hypothetical protein